MNTLKSNLIRLAVAIAAALVLTAQPMVAQANVAHFTLKPNPAVVNCLGVLGGPAPVAHVTVTRGKLNDTLVINAQNIKPGLAFDMFTVQRSRLLSNGGLDPSFTNFGFAWYQSDLQANGKGEINTTIKTILLDQIFGFDPDFTGPINTFHLGFWFNNPNDANVDGCTFDVTKPTPFNGEHQAGPLAMISTPDATTNLGPLCTNPDTTHNPAVCHP
jgi:hypothetical protein